MPIALGFPARIFRRIFYALCPSPGKAVNIDLDSLMSPPSFFCRFSNIIFADSLLILPFYTLFLISTVLKASEVPFPNLFPNLFPNPLALS
jgi:hypothetical protein